MASNSIKTYKITCTLANTAYNVVTGTTSAPTSPTLSTHKGVNVTFQGQNSDVAYVIGGSDIITNGGITVIGIDNSSGTLPDHTYSPSSGLTGSAYNMADWWVSSNNAGAIMIVQLIKHV